MERPVGPANEGVNSRHDVGKIPHIRGRLEMSGIYDLRSRYQRTDIRRKEIIQRLRAAKRQQPAR